MFSASFKIFDTEKKNADFDTKTIENYQTQAQQTFVPFTKPNSLTTTQMCAIDDNQD